MTSPETALVIGGGVAGLAAAWRLAEAGVRVWLVERAPRLGGLVETERPVPSVILEHGADAVLADKPGGMDTLRALGLAEGLVVGGRAPKRAFVARGDALVPMPPGLFAFERKALLSMLRTPLLSPRAKLRLGLELLTPRSDAPDESVASFFARRLGPDVEAALVAPMVRGIFGAESSVLGVRSVFPKLAAMEDGWGSVGLALLLAPRAPRGHGLLSLAQGMDAIPAALATHAARAGAKLATGLGARSLARTPRAVRVTLDDGSTIDADAAVIASDVETAARLVAPLSSTLGDELDGIDATDAEVVSLVYARRAIDHPLDGTGFVVEGTDRRTVACTFASEKWHGRAPEDRAVFRCVLRRDATLSERDLVEAAHEELRVVLSIADRPSITRIRRRRRALPVYGVGHRERIARSRGAAADIGRVALAGNYLGGVGVPDAISAGLGAASALLGEGAHVEAVAAEPPRAAARA